MLKGSISIIEWRSHHKSLPTVTQPQKPLTKLRSNSHHNNRNSFKHTNPMSSLTLLSTSTLNTTSKRTSFLLRNPMRNQLNNSEQASYFRTCWRVRSPFPCMILRGSRTLICGWRTCLMWCSFVLLYGFLRSWRRRILRIRFFYKELQQESL